MKENQLLFPVIVSTIILVLLTGSGCGLLGGKDKKEVSGDLMPLSVGNYWEYEFTYIWKDTLRYEVVKEVQVPFGGEKYTAYAFNLVPFPSDVPEYYWLYRNGEAGLYQMGGIANTDTLFTQYVDKPWPAEEGENWNIPRLAFSRDSLKFYVSDTLSITLVDKSREIDTPAGKFECYVYKFTISNGDDVPRWDYFMYYSSGVGLIAQIATSEGDPENIKEEMYLMDFHLE
ncbi:hypothetical protein [Gracilimonas mengyeensis]|uniref:Lipoprotein n=1 Tax=Gracilimonas mengyeensis TaxID=1302730 RepID=A0A521DVG4_9BACT|nr:hypothetical protein [Gracilimonas mengyeensis]SMO74850.1 hypothetical protein SAMN06265219_10998 [Gracilimonas mengyeensis]